MCEICRQDSHRPFAPSRRTLLLAASTLLVTGAALAKDDKKPPKPENVLSPDAALKRLLKGNERYVEGKSRRHEFKREREALAAGQNPYAAVLSCATPASRPNLPSIAAAAISSSAASPATSPPTRS